MAAHLKRWCGPAKSGWDCSFWNRKGRSRSQNVTLRERRSNATRTHSPGSLEPADCASRTHTPGQSTTARSGSMHAPCRRPGLRRDRKSSVRTRCTKTNGPRPWSTRAPGEFRLRLLWRSSRSVSWNSPSLHVCRPRQPGFDIFPIFFKQFALARSHRTGTPASTAAVRRRISITVARTDEARMGKFPGSPPISGASPHADVCLSRGAPSQSAFSKTAEVFTRAYPSRR